MTQEDLAARRRRKALSDFMRANNLKAGTWARLAGLRSANAIYNFLSGDSESLRQETYEKLAASIPGTTVAQLTGERASTRPALAVSVVVRAEANADRWQVSPDMTPDEQITAAVPEAALRGQGAYGVRLTTSDFDMFYPEGSLLVAVPILMRQGEAGDGAQIIVHRWKDRRCQVLVRQLRLEGRNKAWLWPRSHRPEYQAPLPCPWPLEGAFEHEGSRIEVASLVIGAYVKVHPQSR